MRGLSLKDANQAAGKGFGIRTELVNFPFSLLRFNIAFKLVNKRVMNSGNKFALNYSFPGSYVLRAVLGLRIIDMGPLAPSLTFILVPVMPREFNS